MDYFRIGKHQLIEENVLYTSRSLYILLTEEMTIDQLFEAYSKEMNIYLGIGMEKTLFLSLSFLFMVGKIKKVGNKIVRC